MSSRCFTCQSPYRERVEEMVAAGSGWTEAIRSLPDGSGINPKGLREHVLRGHYPERAEVARRLVAAAGGDAAVVLDRGVERAIRDLVEATAVLDAVAKRMTTGVVRPNVTQGLRAARLLLSHDDAVRAEQRLEERLHQSHEAIASLLMLVKAALPSSGWSEVLRRMDKDDNLRVWLPPAAAA